MTITSVPTGGDAELVADLRAQVSALMAGHAGHGPLAPARRRELAEQHTAEALDAHARQALDAGRQPLSAQAEARVARAVIDHIIGAGGLQQLLDNAEIENINANGCDEVFIRYAGGHYEAGPPIADSDEAMIAMVRTLASEAAFADNELGHGEERGFDRNNPQLDLRLKDGARLCAVMAVSRRPGLSIRRPTLINADLDDLVSRGMLDQPLCRVLQAAMRAKLNIIFAGGTNTGKTTFARAAARAIGPHERLITIEDAYELELHDPLAHPNVLAFQARRANLEGVGAVPMAALVRTALRMDPDRVIVGETRGDEVIDLLKAMSQGNDGSFATVHASSSQQAFSRLMMYAVQAPERLSFEASAMLIAESIDLVVHLNWTPDKLRVVSSVREVTGFDGRDVISNEVWRPGADKRAVPSTPLRTETLDRLEAAGLRPAHHRPGRVVAMTAVAALLGAGVGLGLLAVIAGVRRRNTAAPSRGPGRVITRDLVLRLAIAVFVAALVGVLTRWPVGALLAGIAAYTLPKALGSNKDVQRALARTEAVAIWAEMLRDNMSAAAGLEQAIIVTAPFAPAAIKDDIDELTAALRLGHRLPVALTQLRNRLDDRTGRLVVRALLQASQRQSRDLTKLLTELASRARDRANLRLKIAPGHAKIRTNARIITGFTLAMAAGLIILNPGFLQPYDSLAGQLVLIVVGAVFAAGFLGIARLAKVGMDKVGLDKAAPR